MRSVLASGLLIAGLLITLCGSANAARVHHHFKPREAILRNSHAAIPPRFLAPPVRYDDTPSYNDPSKWGGGAP
jgi:hypothetical protein